MLILLLCLLLLIYIYIDIDIENFVMVKRTPTTPTPIKSKTKDIVVAVDNGINEAENNLEQLSQKFLQDGLVIPGNMNIQGNFNTSGSIKCSNYKIGPTTGKDFDSNGTLNTIFPLVSNNYVLKTKLPLNFNPATDTQWEYSYSMDNSCPPGSFMVGINTGFESFIDSSTSIMSKSGTNLKIICGKLIT